MGESGWDGPGKGLNRQWPGGHGDGAGLRDWAPAWGSPEAVCPPTLLARLACSHGYQGWALGLAGPPPCPRHRSSPGHWLCCGECVLASTPMLLFLIVELFHEAVGARKPQQEIGGPCPETLRWGGLLPHPKLHLMYNCSGKWGGGSWITPCEPSPAPA